LKRQDRHRRAAATRVAQLALALLAPFCASAQDAALPAFKQLDSMEARVQGCVTCHGQSGQGTNSG
jgi:cytochrome c553